jgi:hypothetical protein
MSGNCAHLAVAHRMEVMAGWATLHNQQSSVGPSVGDTARPGASSGKEKGKASRWAAKTLKKIRNSVAGTRTRVSRVRAEYPNQLDYNGFW